VTMGSTNDELPLAGPHATLDLETGAVHHPPNRWSLLRQLDLDNAFDEVVTTIAGTTDDFGYQIHHARRGCLPTRIRLTGAGLASATDILRRLDFSQGLGVGERLAHGTGNSLVAFRPTFGGSILRPASSRQAHVFPSPPLHLQRGVGSEESPTGHWFEGAVVPLELDSFGDTDPAHSKLLGAASTPGIYWRARQFQRLTVNWCLEDAVPEVQHGVHEVFAAAHFPRPVGVAGANPLPGAETLFHASLHLTYLFGATSPNSPGVVKAEIYRPTATPATYDLDGSPPFFSGQTVFRWTTRTRMDMRFGADNTVGSTPTVLTTDENPPTTPASNLFATIVPNDGILAAILSNSNPGIAIGIVAGLSRTPDGQTKANELLLRQQRANPTAGAVHDVGFGQMLAVQTRGTQRDAGWIGIRFLVVIKQSPDRVRQAIDLLAAQGSIGNSYPLPWSYMPAHVADGRFVP
jgi:hypothetical protein